MKFYFLYFFFLLCSVSLLAQSPTTTQWSEEMRLIQLRNLDDPALWDMERMQGDISPVNQFDPIRKGAFPVPPYDSLLVRSYPGGGGQSTHPIPSVPEYRLQVGDKEVMYTSFFIGDGPFYQSKQGKGNVFFTVITVVDTLTAENFALGSSHFLSRNHPDYGGEGSYITKNNKVEFVAFITPDKGAFAIVNMRLFHLEYGNIIVVTPQKDGSFRSLQIKGKERGEEENYDYIKEDILKRPEVIKFLTAEGVI
jgi:hypothetical protein